MNSLISFIFVLGILIFVHEFGHFLFAKLFGVRVLKFSLGFGNKLIGRKWGDTEYLISAFPLGGYVKMFGEQRGDEEITPAEQSYSFSHKTVWQRFCIVAGGPVFNLLFAVFIFLAIFLLVGLPAAVDTTKIGKINPDSVAERVGIEVGDIILSIDGQPTSSWLQVSELVKMSKGGEIKIVLQREGETLTFNAVPAMEKLKNLFGEEVGERYMLGITRYDEIVYNREGLIQSLRASLLHTWNMMYLTVLGIVKIIEGVVPASELGGPIKIAELSGQQFAAGWINLISFMGLLSVNLGVLNLLPIPILDGGHLVFLTVEGVTRRPLSEKVMIWSQKVGIALLGSLMIFVFYNDIYGLIQRWSVTP